MSLVVPVLPFDEIPERHLLRALLRTRLVTELRNERIRSTTPPYYPHKFIVQGFKIHYAMKKENNYDYFIIARGPGEPIIGKIKITEINRKLKPTDVYFRFDDLMGNDWFTVGPSRNKQKLNSQYGAAAVMAATMDDTSRLVGLNKPIDPYIAGAYFAPMLGTTGRAVTDFANARVAIANEVAGLPEPKSHWSNNVNLSSIKVRKSRKRTRRIRRH